MAEASNTPTPNLPTRIDWRTELAKFRRPGLAQIGILAGVAALLALLVVGALARKESRGAHVRDDAHDTPETPNGRDDRNWLKHTLWYRDGNRLDYKPVQMKPMSVDTIELKKRAY